MSEFREDPWFLRWDFIEKLANNELSKIVGIIPVVGYLILFNDKVADALSFNSIVGVNDLAASPFFLSSMFKLRLAFFGSIFVLIANFTFRLRSPKELEHSKSDLEFSDRVLNSYSQTEIVRIEKQVLSDSWILRTHPDKFGRWGFATIKSKNHSNHVARWLTLTFGVVGYAMLALPTLDIAQAVIHDII